jgi:hypothetical protein
MGYEKDLGKVQAINAIRSDVKDLGQIFFGTVPLIFGVNDL